MKVVVPARMHSTRLPRKPMAEIAGAPMVVHAWRRAVEAVGNSNVVVGADDSAIIKVVEAAGGQAVLTRTDHESGTDRVCEVADIMAWPDDTVIVNLQGDEPLMPAALIKSCGDLLYSFPEAQMATVAAPIGDIEALRSPHVVKVVLSETGRALYFSRAVIPHDRDEAPNLQTTRYLRHIGLYAYRGASLRRLAQLPRTEPEEREALEQLRALGHDYHIQVAITEEAPPHGVDTAEDLARVRAVLELS